MIGAFRSGLFNAFANWAIQRAMRTPYTHLFHDDGRPYMQRLWLLRIGMPKRWHELNTSIMNLEYEKFKLDLIGLKSPTIENWLAEQRAMLLPLYPWLGIRIHRIMSSDDRAFHDHPWNYTTLILRGGYTEVTPTGFQPHHIALADDYDGSDPVTYTEHTAVRYNAGSLLRRKANSWHYLVLDPGAEAWTMFCTGRKRQTWGFLADGLLKVPYGLYLRRRRERAQGAVVA